MRDALARKQHRQRALLRLVTARRLATQADLARALRGAGFAATQATISRDIVELGLVKVARDGTHSYAAPAAASTAVGGTDRLRRFCEDYPVEAAAAGNIVVLRSLPGTASTLAAAVDAGTFETIVGTIAGDDTVFVAIEEGSSRPLLARLATFGVATSTTLPRGPRQRSRRSRAARGDGRRGRGHS